MNGKWLIGLASIVGLMGILPGAAWSGEHTDGTRFVPNVGVQFDAITERGDALGFHVGGSPNPSVCKHYQGMVRVDGADGTPFFLVTRSGNLPSSLPFPGLLCDDSPGETDNGHLIVFRMGSRDKNGERLRSNRLRKGLQIEDTPPPLEDAASIYFTVVEDGLVYQDGPNAPNPPPRVYQHPGGMQVVGHMLALVVETPRPPPLLTPPNFSPPVYGPYEMASHESLVMFFDVSDPEAPQWRSSFTPKYDVGGAAGAVGIAPLRDGHYLMVITGGSDNEYFTFYRSTLTNLASADLDWLRVAQIPGPAVADTHQTLNFVREADMQGDLYLLGARGSKSPFKSENERIDLYRVGYEDAATDCEPGEVVCLIPDDTGKRIIPLPTSSLNGRTEIVNLAAASNFYVSPSGELILYATEHDNDGPSNSVSAGEWRHHAVVRDDSPTLLPTIEVGGPYQVNEGDSIVLSASADHPITRPWIQPFTEADFLGAFPVVDYDDHDLDDFDDLSRIRYQTVSTQGFPDLHFDHRDKALSWNWYAPAGCSIEARDFSGAIRTLAGTGALVADPDLSQIFDDTNSEDMARKLDAIDFSEGCDTRDTFPIQLHWDLDSNGHFETTGSFVPFDAANLDGPSRVSIPVEARNPQGGAPAARSVSVEIRNVAPALSPLEVTDSAGSAVPETVPFVVVGLPVTLRADFSDPGLPDHQVASIEWGDGSEDREDRFDFFDEAFGDGFGEIEHAHRYIAPGAFDIILVVADDDLGTSGVSARVDVLTPEQAIGAIVHLLDDQIAGTSDPYLRKLLDKARKSLVGNPGANNGALRMLEKGHKQAALTFLRQAERWMRMAEIKFGVELAPSPLLLEQVIASLGG